MNQHHQLQITLEKIRAAFSRILNSDLRDYSDAGVAFD